MTFHIEANNDTQAASNALCLPSARLCGRVPVFSVRTMDEEFMEFTAPIRIVMALIGIFAATALFLSSVGLYAAIAFHTRGGSENLESGRPSGARHGRSNEQY